MIFSELLYCWAFGLWASVIEKNTPVDSIFSSLVVLVSWVALKHPSLDGSAGCKIVLLLEKAETPSIQPIQQFRLLRQARLLAAIAPLGWGIPGYAHPNGAMEGYRGV